MTLDFQILAWDRHKNVAWLNRSMGSKHKTLAELQARKNAIDIVGAICRMATDMLHRANSMPAEIISLNPRVYFQ
jgi:hypothetical protein